MDPVQRLRELFASRGGAEYLGEAVSLASHMLQAGALAEAAGASEHMVAAAVLHDVGHLVAPTSQDRDAHHEVAGANWLAQLGFPAAVTEPVRLHVAAKRYLCAVEPAYAEVLSVASRRSLALQGGPMTPREAEAFAHLEHATGAVQVRRWDEAAKDPAAMPPAFDHFGQLLDDVVRRRAD
jgi:gamma-butyrobetaine dioxygenase